MSPLMYIITAIAWVGVGTIFGIALAVGHTVFFGDPDINEQIEKIRKARVELEQLRLEIAATAFMKTAIKHNAVVVVAPPKKGSANAKVPKP